jgi:tetratricopeptide (TPR) repeat protein
MRVGKSAQLGVLAPGERSSDPYNMNDDERYALGSANFNDGRYDEAIKFLAELFQRNRTYNEREVARMLLWIHTSQGYYDAKRIVEMFEVLRERYPDLTIPFDKILVVGRAYRDIGEFERAWLVFRATVDASFINDSNVSAVLQDEGQFLGSVDFQEALWRQYPDTPEVGSSWFALAQALYQQAPNAHLIAEQERQMALKRGEKPDAQRRVPTKFRMLQDSIRMLSGFLTLYPTNPLGDDAAFSMTNAFLDLKDYPTVVRLSDVFRARYAKTDFASSFQYMSALGYFWQQDYDSAGKSAEPVANGDSRDRDYARYILGQINHAKGNPAEAIRWYRTVEQQYPDAKEAVSYFEDKRFALEEVTVFRPDQPVELKLKYRNIKEASLQVYRVDLMKLYLREKNLSNITKVNLSGIKPEAEKTLQLGDGKDYKDKEQVVKLDLKDEAAYLVIGRGDDLFVSGMALITPLKIEVQEDAVSGRVRANVIDAVKGGYRPSVHVKAIGSAQSEFRSGETDLRGIFVADGLHGKPTVIAREAEARYAFYRGENWVGPPQGQPQPQPQPQPPVAPYRDYESNLRQQVQQLQQSQYQQFDQMRRARATGVQVKAAR